MITRVEKDRQAKRKAAAREIVEDLGVIAARVFWVTMGIMLIWFVASYFNILSSNYSSELSGNVGEWNMIKRIMDIVIARG